MTESTIPAWLAWGESIAVILASAATVAAALYAYRQFKEARAARRAATAAQKAAADAQATTERAREEATWPYVVASPIPELTDEQTVALLIKNYGQTAARAISLEVVSERAMVPLKRGTFDHGYTGQHEVPLATTLLAPGQEFVETVHLSGGWEVGTLRSVELRVQYESANGTRHAQEYSVTFGAPDLDGLRRPVVDALTGIEDVLRSWTSRGSQIALRVQDTPDPLAEMERRRRRGEHDENAPAHP